MQCTLRCQANPRYSMRTNRDRAAVSIWSSCFEHPGSLRDPMAIIAYVVGLIRPAWRSVRFNKFTASGFLNAANAQAGTACQESRPDVF